MMSLIVILGVLWLLGMITSYTAGGLIHLLLVVAVIMFVINLISGRRAV
ncbi:MAG: lmo0937 family membrane protein [Negativicutes bacterium]